MTDRPPSGPFGPDPGSPAGPGAYPQGQPPVSGQPGFPPQGQPPVPGRYPYPAAGHPGPYPGGQPAGGGYPPMGGHPAGPPPQGGYPPYPGQPYPAQPYPGYPGHPGPSAGWDPADPLVNPPGARLAGWWERCVGAVRRGWRVLLPLVLITQVLPALTVSLLVLALGPALGLTPETFAFGGPEPGTLPDGLLRDLGIFVATIIATAILVGLVQSVGWAAGTWIIARQAAGEPVTLGAALRYGLGRAPGLWGWNLLVGLAVTVGFCLCFLPGIYLAAVFSLVGPVYLFERGNPMGRSFRIFHDRFGMVLGRVALVALVTIGVAVATDMLGGTVMQFFGSAPLAWPLASAPAAVGAVLVTALVSVLSVPAHLFQQVALVVTYAEQRIQEGPVNSARLSAELG